MSEGEHFIEEINLQSQSQEAQPIEQPQQQQLVSELVESQFQQEQQQQQQSTIEVEVLDQEFFQEQEEKGIQQQQERVDGQQQQIEQTGQNDFEIEIVKSHSQQQQQQSQFQWQSQQQSGLNELIDLGAQLQWILELFQNDISQSCTFDAFYLRIGEECIFTDSKDVIYEILTQQEQYFNRHIGKIAKIGRAEVIPEFAKESHNLILTMIASNIQVEGEEFDGNVNFKIFDQQQYRNNQKLYELAFPIKKALIRRESSQNSGQANVWRLVTQQYQQQVEQRVIEFQNEQKQEQIQPQKSNNNTQKNFKKSVREGASSDLNTNNRPSKSSEQIKEKSRTPLKITKIPRQVAKEGQIINEEEDEERKDLRDQGVVSVAKPKNKLSAQREVTEEQRKNLSALYQVEKIEKQKATMEIEEEEEEEENQEEEEEDVEEIEVEKTSVKKEVERIKTSIKKESVKRLIEGIKKKEENEADPKLIEYNNKLKKLQKFVLKKELLYFISSEQFQKKPEVRNMVLPRDPQNKSLLKSYSFATVKHLEAQYK